MNFSNAQLQSALGGVATPNPAQFHWRSPGKAGQAAKFAGKPGWIVPLVVPGSSTGPAVRYELEFEPIGERLVRVTRIGAGR